jgi:sensor histidine kinase YesM
VIGIIKGIVDSDEMFDLLESLQFGQEIVAVLVRTDGSIVTDPESKDLYQFNEEAAAGMSLKHNSALAPEGRPLVFLGLPQFRIKDRIPELDWQVIIQAPYDEVFLPFQNLRSWFVYIVLMSVILIMLLSMVFSWVLSKPIIETDPHLEKV